VASAKRKRPTAYRYPGWLGRAADQAPLIAAGKQAARHLVSQNPAWTDEQFAAAFDAGYDEAAIRHKREVMFALMKHYGISVTDDEECWVLLAEALASQHVPATQFAEKTARGRPKKTNTLNRLADLYVGRPTKAKQSRPGAPEKWGPEECRTLLGMLERGKEMLRKRGAQVTNVAALEAVYAHLRNTHPGARVLTMAHVRDWAKRDARRVPDARARLRK
jgi:hypothetical protein